MHLFCSFGRALGRMGEYSNAMEKLQIALKMEPRNKDTIKEIKLVSPNDQRIYIVFKNILYYSLLLDKRNTKKIFGNRETILW